MFAGHRQTFYHCATQPTNVDKLCIKETQSTSQPGKTIHESHFFFVHHRTSDRKDAAHELWHYKEISNSTIHSSIRKHLPGSTAAEVVGK